MKLKATFTKKELENFIKQHFDLGAVNNVYFNVGVGDDRYGGNDHALTSVEIEFEPKKERVTSSQWQDR